MMGKRQFYWGATVYTVCYVGMLVGWVVYASQYAYLMSIDRAWNVNSRCHVESASLTTTYKYGMDAPMATLSFTMRVTNTTYTAIVIQPATLLTAVANASYQQALIPISSPCFLNDKTFKVMVTAPELDARIGTSLGLFITLLVLWLLLTVCTLLVVLLRYNRHRQLCDDSLEINGVETTDCSYVGMRFGSQLNEPLTQHNEPLTQNDPLTQPEDAMHDLDGSIYYSSSD